MEHKPMKGLKMFPFKNWDKEIEESLANMVSIRREPEFRVGDLITSQKAAEKLPDGAAILSIADDGKRYVHLAVELDGQIMFGDDDYSMSPLPFDYLPAMVIWMPPAMDQKKVQL